MASAKYHEFILRIAEYGFPVRFLREVEAGYNVVPGPSSLVLPWFNVMLLEPGEFDSIELMDSPNLGASTGIMNIYHACPDSESVNDSGRLLSTSDLSLFG